MDHKEDLSITEELVMGLSNNNNVNDATHIIKGKRTKRMRLLSTNTTTVMTSTCSSASGDGGGDDDQGSLSISSTTTTDQEEEDMANCLILLAQGGGGDGGGGDSEHDDQQQQDQKQQVDEDQDHYKIETIKGRKLSEIGTACGVTTTNKVGFYIYECKTCNRTFPSFQALGGHRASHKRPKIMTEEKKPPPPAPPASSIPSSSPLRRQVMDINYDHQRFELGGGGGQLQSHIIKSVPPITNPISLQFGSAQKSNNFNSNNNIKAKIHECSICGSEFTSGQALGGHMRRHRASANVGIHAMSGIETISNATVVADAATVAIEVQPRTILELDLNLPAPEEDLLREPTKFQFTAATQKSMVLSAAPALVDCHY